MEKLEICKFTVSRFTFFEMLFTKTFYLHLSHIYIINTNTVIQSQIDLGFHCFYLEITWNIHGISCHQRGGNPVYYCFSNCCSGLGFKQVPGFESPLYLLIFFFLLQN